MKTVFPYLALIVLFLAGIRLVNRQQKYARARSLPAPVKSITFADRLLTKTR